LLTRAAQYFIHTFSPLVSAFQEVSESFARHTDRASGQPTWWEKDKMLGEKSALTLHDTA
jgi:hypothetical protein